MTRLGSACEVLLVRVGPGDAPTPAGAPRDESASGVSTHLHTGQGNIGRRTVVPTAGPRPSHPRSVVGVPWRCAAG